jgi:microcin C transport system substrate-binding protein
MRRGLIGSGKTCRTLLSLLLLAASVATAHPALAEDGQKLHALTFLDQPKYGPDFKHLDYVDPNAPKGGSVT